MRIGVTALQECLVALGGNLQISGKVFEDALAELQLHGCSDVRMSRVLKTRPVGSDAGNDFLNSAAVFRTEYSPGDLLQRLHEIETRFNRVRTQHWGPRTLDLDLILYNEFEANTPQLVVPHPSMWYRRFVLEPAVEIAAHMLHPVLNESLAQLYARLMCRPLQLEVCCTHPNEESGLLDEVLSQATEFGDAIALYPTNPASCIAPSSFARIVIRKGAKPILSQPFNRTTREIEVVGKSAPEVVSQIEDLRLAMFG